MMSRAYTNKELRRLSYRWSWNRSLAWNYEKMMACGYLTTMLPVIDKVYKDDPDGRLKSFELHSQFFNSEPNLTNVILGINVAIEEEMGAEGLDSVSGIKTSLMGPFAGIGDTLFTSVLATIFGSIAVSTALEGSYFGIILWEIWLFFVMFGLRPYLFKLGYQQGAKLVTTLSYQLKQITAAASVLGLTVVGAVIATTVKVKLGTFMLFEQEINIQERLLDAIMPRFGAVVVVALCYWFLGKFKMKSSMLILIVMAISIILAFFKILLVP